LIITVTIIRASGLHHGESIDSVWETFWQMMSAEVGLIMTSITAFRTFFVARKNEQRQNRQGSDPKRWSSRSKKLLGRLLRPSSWRSRHTGETPGGDTGKAANGRAGAMRDLPSVPRGTMTGIHTFIDGQGRTRMGLSQIMQSHASEETDDSWPLNAQTIQVHHDISSKSEIVRTWFQNGAFDKDTGSSSSSPQISNVGSHTQHSQSQQSAGDFV
jgi:hypothetical protein